MERKQLEAASSADREPLQPIVSAWDLSVTAPAVMSFQTGFPKVRVTSCCFELPEAAPSSPTATAGAGKRQRAGAARSEGGERHERKRLAPPPDAVRLEDRLYYLLQPPLEQLFRNDALHFPFHPFEYQYDGIGFLYARHAAVLADEMGLGKTMQAITAIRLLLRKGECRQVLLVCPKPLVTNWQREFRLWAPELTVSAIQGPPSRRAWLWRHPGALVKIANYELLLRDEEVVTAPPTRFDLVVLDEAQRVKNDGSRTHRVASAIERTRTWALTGTPIENSMDDLVGIFELLIPGHLARGMTVAELREGVRDYVLRRTKDAVLDDLPPKLYRDAEIELLPEQWNSYLLAEKEGVVRLTEMGDEVTIQHVFELVLRLKQICNFDPATQSSAKLERLEADLEEVAASRQKAIVFSQWVGTLERLAPRLERFGTLQYHGKIRTRQRDAIIERFRDDPTRHVLLMSYGAGAVGLNLQFATYVFLFDRWWNPAIEDQAINRAHRIGAAGPVTVTRMMTQGTIEQRIHDVLEEKRELMRLVLADGRPASRSLLSQDDIFGLFKLHVPKRRTA